MNDVAIRVEGLGKQYRIGKRERYRALRDALTDAIYAPFRRIRSVFRPSKAQALETEETIWALKDVSFEIPRGEVVGVIGRNGAGKSTLLKILSRITEPTEGRVAIHGRVGSLLEVGTGFHPELTGRENIFLNGAILGMRRAEISRRFDEIVAFAEIEKFIDTPAKHYSSGMYMRLAFAVAAHLDPEILLVDEVLAVGDVAFQKKCLGKMSDVAKGGRTIILVSHQLTQIRRLCAQCLWIDAGRLQQLGSAAEVLGSYESSGQRSGDARHRVYDDRVTAQFVQWEINGSTPERSNYLNTMGPFTVTFTLKVNTAIRRVHHGIGLYASDGQLIWGTASDGLQFTPGLHKCSYYLPGLPLRPGNYSWRVSLYSDGHLTDVWHCSPNLVVATEPVTHSKDAWAGLLNIPYTFSTNCADAHGHHIIAANLAKISWGTGSPEMSGHKKVL